MKKSANTVDVIERLLIPMKNFSFICGNPKLPNRDQKFKIKPINKKMIPTLR